MSHVRVRVYKNNKVSRSVCNKLNCNGTDILKAIRDLQGITQLLHHVVPGVKQNQDEHKNYPTVLQAMTVAPTC